MSIIAFILNRSHVARKSLSWLVSCAFRRWSELASSRGKRRASSRGPPRPEPGRVRRRAGVLELHRPEPLVACHGTCGVEISTL